MGYGLMASFLGLTSPGRSGSKIDAATTAIATHNSAITPATGQNQTEESGGFLAISQPKRGCQRFEVFRFYPPGRGAGSREAARWEKLIPRITSRAVTIAARGSERGCGRVQSRLIDLPTLACVCFCKMSCLFCKMCCRMRGLVVISAINCRT